MNFRHSHSISYPSVLLALSAACYSPGGTLGTPCVSDSACSDGQMCVLGKCALPMSTTQGGSTGEGNSEQTTPTSGSDDGATNGTGSSSDSEGAEEGETGGLLPFSSRQYSLAAGVDTTCAITTGGALKCWGSDDFGQIGNGSPNVDEPFPTAVLGLSSGVISVQTTWSFTCALTENDSIACWGSDGFGQLGDGGPIDDADRSPSPIEVMGLSGTPSAIGLGWGNSCAIMDSGALRCWGSDAWGSLGDGPGEPIGTSLPKTILSSDIYAFVGGTGHGCALSTSGGVACWGWDYDGEIGNGEPSLQEDEPTTVTGLSAGVIQVSAGAKHSCVVTQLGKVRCWGLNENGELGIGNYDSPQMAPVPVELDEVVVSVACGGEHSCVLTGGGGVKCWGSDEYGQLGDGSTNSSGGEAVNVIGLDAGVVAIASGALHSCARLESDSIRCWGSNMNGRLGNGEVGGTATSPVTAIFP